MNLKTRADRIDFLIDQVFEKETDKEASQNVEAVAKLAMNRFGIDMNRTAQISLGVTMDGSVLIDSESVAYLEYCEKQLGIGDAQ